MTNLRMIEKVESMFLILALVVFGVITIYDKNGYFSSKYNRYISFGDAHWLVGLIFVSFGLGIAYYTFF